MFWVHAPLVASPPGLIWLVKNAKMHSAIFFPCRRTLWLNHVRLRPEISRDYVLISLHTHSRQKSRPPISYLDSADMAGKGGVLTSTPQPKRSSSARIYVDWLPGRLPPCISNIIAAWTRQQRYACLASQHISIKCGKFLELDSYETPSHALTFIKKQVHCACRLVGNL